MLADGQQIRQRPPLWSDLHKHVQRPQERCEKPATFSLTSRPTLNLLMDLESYFIPLFKIMAIKTILFHCKF